MKNSILLTILTLIISSFIAEAMPATNYAQAQQEQANDLPGRGRKFRKQHHKKPFQNLSTKILNFNHGRSNGHIKSVYTRESARMLKQSNRSKAKQAKAHKSKYPLLNE